MVVLALEVGVLTQAWTVGVSRNTHCVKGNGVFYGKLNKFSCWNSQQLGDRVEGS